MTTTPHDVTPPAGASFVDEWQPGPPPYRVVLGATYIVGDVEVQTSAIQFADGAIDRVGLVEPPKVHVRANREGGLSVKQALELASVLFEAAVERVGAMIDGAGTSSA